MLTAPEWRRTTQSGTLVANFKVASTSRRLDRENNRWVDGNSLRVRVNCWRKLAEGVAACLMVGDPVVVVGRMYTRDWTDADGNHRTQYELEALAVGHDLSRGRAKFVRNRPTLSTSAVADPEAETRVQGQETEPVPAGEAPRRSDFFDDDPDFADLPSAPTPHYDPVAEVRGTGFTPPADVVLAGAESDDEHGSAFLPDGVAPVGDVTEGELSGGGDRSGADSPGDEEPVPADGAQLPAVAVAAGRNRRGRSRVPVPV